MSMKFATYRVGNEQLYGAVTDEGMIALSPDFPDWPTLREVIENNGLDDLAKAAEGKSVTHTDFIYERPIPHPEKIICVGVNFPDRNAEYKDGSAQPQYMSLFPRFERGFTGHGQNLVRPPENETLDYEGEIAIVIGKKGRRISQAEAYDHIAMKAPFAIGCAMRSSMSPKARTGTTPALWVLGWCRLIIPTFWKKRISKPL